MCEQNMIIQNNNITVSTYIINNDINYISSIPIKGFIFVKVKTQVVLNASYNKYNST